MPLKRVVREDLTGRRFGRLIVIGLDPKPRHGRVSYWFVRCDCKAVASVYGGSLRAGTTRSCGCLHRELVVVRNSKHGATSGGQISLTYRSWESMIARCHRRESSSFARYGGRGITVCERWSESFAAFLEDMGERPSKSHTIDRIDGRGNYGPGNCRWATKAEQVRNRGITKTVSLDGVTCSVGEWAERAGIPYGVLWRRLRSGWDTKKAIRTPYPSRNSQLGPDILAALGIATGGQP